MDPGFALEMKQWEAKLLCCGLFSVVCGKFETFTVASLLLVMLKIYRAGRLGGNMLLWC